MLFALLVAAAVTAPSIPCQLGATDREANRTLGFKDFDQLGALPSTARALAGRGCYAEAVEANIDYLLHGPDLTDYERNVVPFHTGQYRANSGKEGEAALLIASTRRGPDPNRPGFDWDAYVIGTYAFLAKDGQLLDQMIQRLSATADSGGRMNASTAAIHAPRRASATSSGNPGR
jgi:hypothetical protein